MGDSTEVASAKRVTRGDLVGASVESPDEVLERTEIEVSFLSTKIILHKLGAGTGLQQSRSTQRLGNDRAKRRRGLLASMHQVLSRYISGAIAQSRVFLQEHNGDGAGQTTIL